MEENPYKSPEIQSKIKPIRLVSTGTILELAMWALAAAAGPTIIGAIVSVLLGSR